MLEAQQDLCRMISTNFCPLPRSQKCLSPLSNRIGARKVGLPSPGPFVGYTRGTLVLWHGWFVYEGQQGLLSSGERVKEIDQAAQTGDEFQAVRDLEVPEHCCKPGSYNGGDHRRVSKEMGF